MESLEITLVEGQSMFFLPGKFHLSFEKPGPIKMDKSLFTNKELQWLRNASYKRIISVKGIDFAELQSKSKDRPLTPAEIKQQAEESKLKQLKHIQTVLDGSTPSITKFVQTCTDIGCLKLMIDREKVGKNRPKVLASISDKVNLLSTTLANSIGAPVAPQKDPNLPDVEESDLETITVKVGADDE